MATPSEVLQLSEDWQSCYMKGQSQAALKGVGKSRHADGWFANEGTRPAGVRGGGGERHPGLGRKWRS